MATPNPRTAATASSGTHASWWLSAWFVVPLMVAAVFGSRYAAMSLASELNPDESQMMAQVMRLRIDPVPWRGMDGTTSGPLNTWILYVAHAMGMPLDYHWTHFLAAAMLASLSVLSYATLRQVSRTGVAAAAGAVTAVSIVLAQGANFTHFSSELVPAALTSAAFLCIAVRRVHPRHGLLLEGLAALLVGCLPWTKFQAIPGAVALGLWIAWGILHSEGREQGARWRRLLLVAGAAMLPTSLLLGIVIAGGAWPDFWTSYVIGNSTLVGHFNAASMARKVLQLFQPPPSRLLVGTIGLGVSWWGLRRPGWVSASAPLRSCLVASAAVAGISTLAVLMPREVHAHYEILLIPPLSLLAGLILETWLSGGRAASSGRIAGIVFAAFMFGVPLSAGMEAEREIRATCALRAGVDNAPARRIARLIRSASPSAKRMAVWGWMPSLYVETGIAPGTRHAVCHFVIDPGPARQHLRASFFADIRRERPEVIVDAVAGGCFRWSWGSSERLGSFPELAEYVRRNYVLAAEEELAGDDDPVRVYVARRPPE